MCATIFLFRSSRLRFCSLASRFLIDKLQKEQPEYFNMVVNTLLAKAVDLNDEKLVSNPYLQIKAILEMSTTSRRKEHGMSPL